MAVRIALAAWAIGLPVGILVADARAQNPAGEAAGKQDGQEDRDAQGDANEESFEDGLYLPSDRQRQRQLDRAIRLIDDGRWSDASTLLDEILSSENDSFHLERRPHAAKEANAEPRAGSGRGDAGPGRHGSGKGATWKSLKSVASDLIDALGKEGREAYELQFRLRAERALEKAVADGDADALMAVARRWFHTPAGGKAGMLLALAALETGQPIAAVAWLDRLRASGHVGGFEPTLSVMRAIAYRRAGDTPKAVAVLDEARRSRRVELRIAGRNVNVSYPTGGAEAWLEQVDGPPPPRSAMQASEWPMAGGNPSRNAGFDGFRPLLAPRYRVSLARHPEEARGLERHRSTMAEQQVALIPAGQPLAVAGRVLVRSALGLLAVDFETGKRVWMQSGPFGAFDESPFSEDALGGDQRQRVDDSVFEDATSGAIASDGRLVFAVENPRQAHAVAEMQAAFRNPQIPMQQQGTSNSLSAYEVAGKGRLAWRLSGRGQADSAEAASEERSFEGWIAGPPLPVAGQLFVLVESKGGIRLDVLEAASGKAVWSQPLAELDDGRAIDKPSGRDRRFAGLTPSLAEGVLVCPTGAGAIVGVDLATRTLLWAYRYPSSATETMPINGGVFAQALGPGGMVIRRGPNGAIVMQGPGAQLATKNRWIDGTPIVADGRVVVSPRESNELHCLDLRSGSLLWRIPRKNSLYVAGVVDGRVIVVGGRGVEAVSLDSGEPVWKEPVSLGTAGPCGRGCVVRGRLLLPTDAPEVVEIDLARGEILGRSAGRGGQRNVGGQGGWAHGAGILPGNLIAYRGEVISQTASSLDVYHQSEPLEKAVETALSKDADDPWALYWRGQTLLDRGRTGEGIASVQASHAADPKRIPAGMVADTILFSLERDFPAASSLWQEAAALAGDSGTRASVLRVAVDGFLRARDPVNAWQPFRRFAEEPPPEAEGSFVDSADPSVVSTTDRWIRGRLQEILTKSAAATPPATELAREIEAMTRRQFERATASTDQVGAIARFLDRFDTLFPANATRVDGDTEQPGLAARKMLCERLATVGGSADSDSARGLALGRDLLLLSMLRSGDAPTRDMAARFVPPRGRTEPTAGGTDAADGSEAWPVGRVVVKREERQGRGMNGQPHRLARVVPVPCDADVGPTAAGLSIPDLRLSYDVQNVNAVIASDGLGRRLGDPLAFESGMMMFGGMQPSLIDATAVGRVVVVRHGGTVSAFELAGAARTAVEPAGKPAKERNRKLWSTTGTHGVVVGNARVIIGNGNGIRRAGAMPRNGGMPLGMRLVEPAVETPAVVGVQVGRGTTAGVPLIVNQSLELRDVLTGAVRWTRHGMPASCDLVGDERFLTVLPRDGRNAIVVSMVDGREVRRCDLPPREQRLCASGRRLVAIDEAGRNSSGASPLSLASTVRVSVFDPATGGMEPLGDFPADARATMVGGEHLAVLDGQGRLTLLRIADATTVFARTLDQMPAGLEGLHVLPWNDRLIVVASRQETAEERQEMERLGTVTGIPHAWGMEETPVVTASIWSIDRESGESLWPMPASVMRHGLLLHQPAGLPVLVFARQVDSRRGGERPKVGLLCLDKRTGHELHADDRLTLDANTNMLSTCDVSGDPAGHRIMLEIGSERFSLTFDGSSIAPRPPYQASGRSTGGKDVWRAFEQLMQQIILPIPIPAPIDP